MTPELATKKEAASAGTNPQAAAIGKQDDAKKADWRIASFSRSCAACRSPFLAGQPLFSYLRIDAEERIGFERIDVCVSCWPARLDELRRGSSKQASGAAEAADQSATPESSKSPEGSEASESGAKLPPPIFWRTRRPREKGAQHVVDLVAMRQLFIQLLEDERPEIEALRYVVGLMLARKKSIRIIRAGGGARGDLYFKDPREGRDDQRVRLPVPRLDSETIDALKAQLGDILSSGI